MLSAAAAGAGAEVDVALVLDVGGDRLHVGGQGGQVAADGLGGLGELGVGRGLDQLGAGLGAGVGVVQQAKMFAAIDNTVTLPGFTRVDGALYFTLGPVVRAQLNVENLFDARYYGTSQGNNNILPGASRTLRLSLSAGL